MGTLCKTGRAFVTSSSIKRTHFAVRMLSDLEGFNCIIFALQAKSAFKMFHCQHSKIQTKTLKQEKKPRVQTKIDTLISNMQ